MRVNKNLLASKNYVLIIFLLGSINIYSQNTHIGKWEGYSDDEYGFFIFDVDSFAIIGDGNGIMGGREFLVEETKCKLTYNIDYNTTPIGIDFIVTRLDNNQELGGFIGIIEFIHDDTMKIRIDFSNSGRPKDFLPEGNEDTVILSKVKE